MIAAAAVLAVASFIPPEDPQAVQTPVRTPGPADWVGWALTDLAALPAADQPYQRYVAIPPWATPDWAPALVLAVNLAANHSEILVKPVWIQKGYMARFDLRHFGDVDDVAAVLKVWDSLALDEPYLHFDRVNSDGRAVVIPPYIQAQQAALLTDLNYSPGSVYRADQFIFRLLDSHYYEFRRYVKADGSLKSYSEILTEAGLDEATAQRVGGDLRAVMLKSDNTGHQRRIDIYGGLAARVNEGRVFVTRDCLREEKDPDRLPSASLLAFRNAAREVILERPDGLHDYFVTDGAGNTARTASQEVVTDETVPRPFPAVLTAGISCVRCHGQNSGLQPVKHDLATLLESGLSIQFDLGEADQADALQRLYGLYTAPRIFDRKLQRSRDDLNDAVFLATEGFFVTEEDPKSVPAAFAAISAIYGGYVFQYVDAAQALAELGHPVEDPRTSVARLNELLGQPVGEVTLTEAALRAGLEVRRSDFERIYIDLATMATNRKETK